MGIEIISNTDNITVKEMPVGTSEYTLSATVPDTIKIKVYGKNPKDTIVDSEGNILQDKYILLRDLRIDQMSVCAPWLPNSITLHTDKGHTVQSNYWGFNGNVEIKIAPTAFQFLAGTYIG